MSSVKNRDYRRRAHIDKDSHHNQQLHAKKDQRLSPTSNVPALTVPIRIPQKRRFRTKQAKRNGFRKVTAAFPVSSDHVWGDDGRSRVR
jgi:hypothetical protein